MDKDKDKDTSMGDDSIDTATWDKLGLKDKASDTVAPAAWAAKDLEERQVVVGRNGTGFNQYGSNMSLGLDLDKGISASCDSEGRSMLVSPVAADVGGLRALVSRSPISARGLGSGGVRLHKKTAGCKTPPVAPASPPSVRAGTPASHRPVVMALTSPGGPVGGPSPAAPPPPSDALRPEVTKAVPISTAKRSKAVVATPVAQERASSRSKGAKGNLPALQRAQLLVAQ